MEHVVADLPVLPGPVGARLAEEGIQRRIVQGLVHDDLSFNCDIESRVTPAVIRAGHDAGNGTLSGNPWER
jgi:hypothetical protein